MEKLFEVMIYFNEYDSPTGRRINLGDAYLSRSLCGESFFSIFKFPYSAYFDNGRIRQIPLILKTIAENPGCTVEDIAEYINTGIKPLNQRLSGLIRYSTIIRKRDGRNYRYYITIRGYEYLKEIGCELNEPINFVDDQFKFDTNFKGDRAQAAATILHKDNSDDINFEDD